MDQIIVDVTDLKSVQSGERVILIGRSESCSISLNAFAKIQIRFLGKFCVQ